MGASPATTPIEPIQLSVSPASGPPGTVVTLSGYIPNVGAHPATFSGVINFGGFPDGLAINPDRISWSTTNPGHFVTRFTVPPVPWLSPKGEVPLTPGTYQVGIQCFGVVVPGCATRPDEASIPFHLTGSGTVAPTPTLSITPAEARPGDTITVSGWAPLTEEFGPHPFGYQLVWEQHGMVSQWGGLGNVNQTANGDVSATIRLPATLAPFGPLGPGSGHLALEYTFTALYKMTGHHKGKPDNLVVAPTPFTVLAPLAWRNAVRPGSVTALTSNQNQGFFAGLASGGGLVFSASGGGLWKSADGGRHWMAVPLKTLAPVIAAEGFKVFGGVAGVVVAPGHPKSLFISVSSENPRYGVPPIQLLGAYTTDGGAAWHAVPVPPGQAAADFGGYQVVGKAVWAWFTNDKGVMAAEATWNGGQSWAPVVPHCPAQGPCLYMGPVPSDSYGAMGVAETSAIVTAHNHRWVTVATTPVNMGGPSTLVTLGGNTALLVGNPQYPVQLTTDNGASWTYVAVPPLPANGGIPTSLRILPNGTLLALDSANSRWYELAPGADAWASVPSDLTLRGFPNMAVVGRMVYWETIPLLNGQAALPPSHFLAVPASRY
jgi:hypothetical protein